MAKRKQAFAHAPIRRAFDRELKVARNAIDFLINNLKDEADRIASNSLKVIKNNKPIRKRVTAEDVVIASQMKLKTSEKK